MRISNIRHAFCAFILHTFVPIHGAILAWIRGVGQAALVDNLGEARSALRLVEAAACAELRTQRIRKMQLRAALEPALHALSHALNKRVQERETLCATAAESV